MMLTPRLLQRACFAAALLVGLLSAASRAQDGDELGGPTPPGAASAAPGPAAATKPSSPIPTLWDLAIRGGLFMIPIAFCSIVVVTVAVERLIGLRRGNVVPRRFLKELEQIASRQSGLDPRVAYRLCKRFPSPMARVVAAALKKVGRPHAEVEKAVEDAAARAGTAMYSRVRPLNICTSISPLLGLIGTVQGMIMAFIVTSTTTATGAAKAQELAQGIYTALVTTFAGLCVAVPSVLFAHYFEGRIERLLGEMEDVMLRLLPLLERFESTPHVRSAGHRTARTAAADRPTPRTPATDRPATPPAAAPSVPVKSD